MDARSRRIHFVDTSRADLRDRAGHLWTPREMFALGPERFSKKYVGRTRGALDLYILIAEEAKWEEVQRLSVSALRLFRRLDSAIYRFETAWDKVAVELSGVRGGTALHGEILLIEATREDFLRQLALGWTTPCAKADRSWYKAVRELRLRLDPKLLKKNWSHLPDPEQIDYHKARREVQAALIALERLREELPAIAVLSCSRRFLALCKALDGVM